ncbi:MAG: hypothetical protein H6981_09515 [Gammaproteobacteria bacterium]|nr:hypothetical protein [Gammaproteobacteria bacterium]
MNWQADQVDLRRQVIELVDQAQGVGDTETVGGCAWIGGLNRIQLQDPGLNVVGRGQQGVKNDNLGSPRQQPGQLGDRTAAPFMIEAQMFGHSPGHGICADVATDRDQGQRESMFRRRKCVAHEMQGS